MHHTGATFCFGASGGFTGAALLEVLRSPGTGGWLMFLASLISTVVGLWISERSRAARIVADAARVKRDVAHDRALLEMLEAIRGKA